MKLPQRTPALPVTRTGAAGGDFSGCRHESSQTNGGSSCASLFWHLPGPTRRCADRTRPPDRAGRLDPLRIVLRLLCRCRLPQRWPARRGDARWLGGFADVVEDLLHGAGIVDEGDDAHLTVAGRATQWQGFMDARQQHRPQITGIMEQPPQASAGRGAGDDFSFFRARSVSPQSPTLILMTHPHEPVR